MRRFGVVVAIATLVGTFAGLAPATPAAALAPPVIVQQLTATSIDGGQAVRFAAAVTSDDAPVQVHWERTFDHGETWQPGPTSALTDDGTGTYPAETTLSTDPENDARYRATFSNPTGTVTTITLGFPSTPGPVVTLHPVGTTLLVGAQPYLLSAAATGSAATTVQWFYRQAPTSSPVPTGPASAGVLTDGVVSSSFPFYPSSPFDGYFFARFVEAGVTADTDLARVTVTAPAAPSIVQQPVAAGFLVGSKPSHTLTAAATGTQPMFVQWFGRSTATGTPFPVGPEVPVTVGTSSVSGSLTISGTSSSDRWYFARFRNAGASTDTTSVRVVVGSAPFFGPVPVGTATTAGVPVTVEMTVTGQALELVEFQRSATGASPWVSLPTVQVGTTSTYRTTIANPQTADTNARYRLLARSAVTEATSPQFQVRVYADTAPFWMFLPPGTTPTVQGTSVTLTASAGPPPGTTVRWERNSPIAPGCTFVPFCFFEWREVASTNGSVVHTVPPSTCGVAPDAQYRALATNARGTISSYTIQVSGVASLAWATAPASTLRYVDGQPTAVDAGTLRCTTTTTDVWQQSTDGSTWTTLAGSPPFTFDADDVGTFIRVRRTWSAGTLTSSAITLQRTAPAGIVTGPSSQIAAPGQAVTFTVAVDPADATIQWQRRTAAVAAVDGAWTNLSGSTSTSIVRNAALANDGEQYRAVVTVRYGAGNGTLSTAASAPATLTVGIAPTFTTQPSPIATTIGSPATVSVAVAGTPAPSLRWQTSPDGSTWTDVAGETGTSFTLPAATAVSTVHVRAVATNRAGEVPSDAVTVTSRQPQTITLYAIPEGLKPGDVRTVTANASSRLPVTFSAAGGCTVAGRTLTITAYGPCTLTATQAGDATWHPATASTTRIARAPQTITFPGLPVAPVPGSKVTLAATSTSGLAVSYVAAGACTLSGRILTFTTAGQPCTVTARQNGNSSTAAAGPVVRTTTPAVGNQTITVYAIPEGLRVGSVVTVTATATSKLPVTFSTTGGCTVSGRTLTITATGPCTLIADQAGDASWNPAPTASTTRITKADQEITFDELPAAPAPGTTVLLTATASSGLSVSYTVAGGCTLSGRTLRFTTADVPCTVTARQSGNGTWFAAPPVVRTTTPTAPV